MTIGDKIKFIRKHRNLTQKELGLLCDFPTTTAQSRIRQYESNQKSPKESGIDKLADALNVCKESFFETDLTFETQAIHALFDIEDFHGLRPVKIDGHIYLSFEPIGFGQFTDFINHREFLQEWYNAAQRYAPVLGDSKEEIEHKREEYMLWKYEYPNNQRSDEEKEALLKQKEETERILHELNQKLMQYKDK